MSAPKPSFPPGTELLRFETLDSTNEEARRQAKAGVRGPLWILAETQSRGRGREGRSWASPKGNLMASYLFTPELPVRDAAQLSLAAALAVIDVLDGVAPGLAQVKWPNDVLLRGKKTAGILLESETGAGGALAWLAIGIGINLSRHPEGMPFPATSLAAEGFLPPSPSLALAALAAALGRWIAIHAREGFVPLRSAWLARGPVPGTPMRARIGGTERSGFFAGLDENGALLLADEAGGVTAIGAGEVFPS